MMANNKQLINMILMEDLWHIFDNRINHVVRALSYTHIIWISPVVSWVSFKPNPFGLCRSISKKLIPVKLYNDIETTNKWITHTHTHVIAKTTQICGVFLCLLMILHLPIRSFNHSFYECHIIYFGQLLINLCTLHHTHSVCVCVICAFLDFHCVSLFDFDSCILIALEHIAHISHITYNCS